MYEASGQWSTTHSQPQPLLSDGREQRGEEGVRKGSGDCILTIPRSILSSLNLPSFLPTLYPIYPLSSPPRSSLFPYVFLCSIHPSTPSTPPTPSATSPGLSPCSQTGNPVGRKMIPEGSRGVGGRLCPWSRCLTFAKLAKHPSPTPVRGEVRGVGQERGVRQGGQKTAGQGRSAGATCPQKQTTVTHFHSEDHLFVCPSPLPSARPLFLCFHSMRP